MGISIEEAIKQLETYTIPCGKYKAAYDLAVETMRKYQKIQAYMKKLEKNGQYGTLRKLKIVLGEVEDGNK